MAIRLADVSVVYLINRPVDECNLTWQMADVSIAAGLKTRGTMFFIHVVQRRKADLISFTFELLVETWSVLFGWRTRAFLPQSSFFFFFASLLRLDADINKYKNERMNIYKRLSFYLWSGARWVSFTKSWVDVNVDMDLC